MKTVLVTGGCGFIGSHFVRLLLAQQRWRVVNLDKLTYAGNRERLGEISEGAAYRFVMGDIADRTQVDELFRTERPWGVVNFAAETHVDRSILDASPFLTTNVAGTRILLEGVRVHGVERFLQVSTDEVYGDVDGKDSCFEESPVWPSSPYAASKASADLLSLAYHRTYGVPILIARSSNNYGPFQFPEKLVPLTIRNAIAGKELPVYGDGLQRRDWLYVDDNCEALLTILERGEIGSIYNVGTGEERTNLSVVDAICRALASETGRDLEELRARIRFVEDRPGHDRRYALDNSRVRRDLGWSPQVSFDAGLPRTVRWYIANAWWMQKATSSTEFRKYEEAVYVHSWRSARSQSAGVDASSSSSSPVEQ
jgi:dTDP-glucose 4,6-dehydratase